MSTGLDIAFFGSSLVSAYWNGAATYYRGILAALAARGHRITFYEPDAFERQRHRDIPDPDWARVVVYDAADTAGPAACLEAARPADLIVKASGVGVFDAWLEAAVPTLRRPDNLIAFWDVDAPATLDRLERDPADPFRALVACYDLILTYGGGAPVVERYQRFGARLCVPIYNGLDPATHHPDAPQARFAADLGLIANRLPDREARIDAFFLEAARRRPGDRFLLAGNGWQDKPVPPNTRVVGHLYTADHNGFNTACRAVLNVSRDSMARSGFSPATRVFEAAGAGACLITDDWPGIELFFEPGVEILVARDGAEVAEHLAALTPERARDIGRRARERALADHCYATRVELLERVLAGAGGNA
jgi:spore maturation protein CgeB